MGLDELIELGDPDELLREIDRRCEQRDWDGLVELRDRCRLAVERGKQLWGVAAHAEYRTALEAPGDYIDDVIEAQPSAIALGPLAEVAASTHEWRELRDSLPDGPVKAVVAYECVARGEDLSGEHDLDEHVAMFELPLALQSWEPAYPVGEYRATEARFPAPVVSVLSTQSVDAKDHELVVDGATTALMSLVRVWLDESNGSAEAVAVNGGVAEAISALSFLQLDVARISFRDALALMAWAGASGGAQGRRNGMAAGRSKAWWALASLVDAADEWPIPPGELGKRGEELYWFTWKPNEGDGWHLRLLAVDPVDEVTFAIEASDQVE